MSLQRLERALDRLEDAIDARAAGESDASPLAGVASNIPLRSMIRVRKTKHLTAKPALNPGSYPWKPNMQILSYTLLPWAVSISPMPCVKR